MSDKTTPTPSTPPEMARIHELMTDGNAGMARMDQSIMSGNPGMERMHELMMRGAPPAGTEPR